MGKETLVNVGAILSAVVALGTLIALLYEYRKSNAVKRAGHIAQMIDKFRDDPDTRGYLYMFQYNGFKYSEEFHDDIEMQRKVDKALSFLSYVCYLSSKKIIAKEDFSFFEIEVSQALRSYDVEDYLYNLYQFECYVAGISPVEQKKKGIERFTFSFLLKYGVKHGLIDDSFFDPKMADNGRYHHYLNF